MATLPMTGAAEKLVEMLNARYAGELVVYAEPNMDAYAIRSTRNSAKAQITRRMIYNCKTSAEVIYLFDKYVKEILAQNQSDMKYDKLNRAYQKYMRNRTMLSDTSSMTISDSTTYYGTQSISIPFTYVSPVVDGWNQYVSEMSGNVELPPMKKAKTPKKQSSVMPQTGKRMITLED